LAEKENKNTISKPNNILYRTICVTTEARTYF